MQKLVRHGLATAARLMALAVCLAVLPAQARVIADLYEVVEPVPSRDAGDRAEASSRGLEQVFVRVTGDPAIAGNPVLGPALRDAQAFMQSYRYVTEDDQLYVHLSYDARAVSDKVHELQLPMWPNNRPGTLVWLAVDTLQGGRSYVSDTDFPELYATLEAAAVARGLPLEFPALDGADRRAMPLGTLWAQDERAVKDASARYQPDASLMGRLLQLSQGRWQANWLLTHGGRTYAFDASGDSPEAVAQQGIDEAANLLAQRYAVRPTVGGEASSVVLELVGISSFADYSEASAFLRGLAQVSRADLLQVDSDRMRVELSTAVPMQNLRDALALNRKLQAEAEQDPIDLNGYRAPLGSMENPLRYRWH
ncbi:DUF2066 domain-containing protein [Microbulbifer yueqingensis]|uniref:DUF2066 domain-containing protein n=1 Tax=Microbulbifer yueqingensis TaxID=658219 RepID=A0A1G9E0Y1_9GAMM|nr:DUF2066 domain-containing protein [Microbulbifer yueqingensis]SDK69762.1 hypothetical protein SAMN05216212_2974 [Microbulbifer yueqingensis]